MNRDLTTLFRPNVIAVIGASATKLAQGNLVINNLREQGFGGKILPVHRTADLVEGLPTIRSIEDLPSDVDLAIASVPAGSATQTANALDMARVKSSIFFAAGFSEFEAKSFRETANSLELNVLGPNCMGFINLTDSAYLYPAKTPKNLKKGNVALIAQSGSAAITVMNSACVGFSKVITVGSEFQLSADDYLTWLATDPDTTTIGIVLESINDPDAFARAAKRCFKNGKALVVLKVGQSKMGAAATLAHTGSMTSDAQTYNLFFKRHGIPTVSDYDELIAAVECLEMCGQRPREVRLAIAGISGGQTALACDIAESVGIALSDFAPATTKALKAALPGVVPANPIDFGAVVSKEQRDSGAAVRAILADEGTDAIVFVQDCQAGLSDRSVGVYLEVIKVYCESAKGSNKPVVAISPTSGEIHYILRDEFSKHGIPIVRGLQEGLVAIRTMNGGVEGDQLLEHSKATSKIERGISEDIRNEIAAHEGALKTTTVNEILGSYGIPVTKSFVVQDVEEAIHRSGELRFPIVVKVSSREIPHRSDVGGVVLGVQDQGMLRDAVLQITKNVKTNVPHAMIDGFEIQEEFSADLEAMAGFVSAPPFGNKLLVGSGGTLVELMSDISIGLAPVSFDDAEKMIADTMLGARLAGYRNLLPKTLTASLANLIVKLSLLAEDLGEIVTECDLNPILIRKGTGEIMVVDALMSNLKQPSVGSI